VRLTWPASTRSAPHALDRALAGQRRRAAPGAARTSPGCRCERRLRASDIAVVVNDADPASVEIGRYSARAHREVASSRPLSPGQR
jgi:hypothetical protein